VARIPPAPPCLHILKDATRKSPGIPGLFRVQEAQKGPSGCDVFFGDAIPYWRNLNRRGIAKDVLYAFVHKKMIYESAQYHNVVFVGFDKDGTPRQQR